MDHFSFQIATLCGLIGMYIPRAANFTYSVALLFVIYNQLKPVEHYQFRALNNVKVLF